MVLPNKKSIQELRINAQVEGDYLKKDKLDFKAQKELADILEGIQRKWIMSYAAQKELGKIVKWLRG